MTMSRSQEQRAVFAETEREYRRRLGDLDLAAAARVLGVAPAGAGLEVLFFGRPYQVGAAGVVGPDGAPPDFAVRVILLQLLLRCPAQPPPADSAWAAFRDFPDAAPLTGYFTAQVKGYIRETFRGRLPDLAAACARLPGRPEPGFPHDLAVRIAALPHLDLLLLFSDGDAELPAACSLLFPRHADGLLDMECLVMTGEALGRALAGQAI